MRDILSNEVAITCDIGAKLDLSIDEKGLARLERPFSLAKRCYGLGMIKAKLDLTTRSSIALSILTMM